MNPLYNNNFSSLPPIYLFPYLIPSFKNYYVTEVAKRCLEFYARSLHTYKVVRLVDGSFYFGPVSANEEPTGVGTITKNGEVIFHGLVIKGLRCLGQGKLSNGCRFIGIYDDLEGKEKEGMLYDAAGNFIYGGAFVHGDTPYPKNLRVLKIGPDGTMEKIVFGEEEVFFDFVPGGSSLPTIEKNLQPFVLPDGKSVPMEVGKETKSITTYGKIPIGQGCYYYGPIFKEEATGVGFIKRGKEILFVGAVVDGYAALGLKKFPDGSHFIGMFAQGQELDGMSYDKDDNFINAGRIQQNDLSHDEDECKSSKTNPVNATMATVSNMRTKKIYSDYAFGKEAWEYFFQRNTYDFGNMAEGPLSLSDNLVAILTPKILKFCYLIAIPQRGDGKPFKECILGSVEDNSTENRPYWLLIMKDLFTDPDPLINTQALLKKVSETLKFDFQLPKSWDVAAAISIHYAKTGQDLLPSNHFTYCEEERNQKKHTLLFGGTIKQLSIVEIRDEEILDLQNKSIGLLAAARFFL